MAGAKMAKASGKRERDSKVVRVSTKAYKVLTMIAKSESRRKGEPVTVREVLDLLIERAAA